MTGSLPLVAPVRRPADVLGLPARHSEEPVVKVMLRNDSVRVLIPDDNIRHRDFHDVLLFDMTNEDAPYVAVNDLSALRQQWPVLVVSGMTQR